MKKSKLFTRVFWFTLILWVFFSVSSAVVGFHQHSTYLFYHIGLMAAMIFFLAMKSGLERKEFNADVVKKFKELQSEVNQRIFRV